jgi:uncharacterized protein YndB with AHSA1/START domain
MVPDRIERDILIDAPVEVVWSVVTEPEHIKAWFADAVELDARQGGAGTLTWMQPGADRHTAVALRIERLDRPRFFSFRWNFPPGQEPTDRNATLVEFTLSPDGGGTRLHLVESGIRTLDRSDDQKTTYADEHTSGWDVLLAKLVEYAPSQRGASAR